MEISVGSTWDNALITIEAIRKRVMTQSDTSFDRYLLCDFKTLVAAIQTQTSEELVAIAIFQLLLAYLILNNKEEVYLPILEVSLEVHQSDRR